MEPTGVGEDSASRATATGGVPGSDVVDGRLAPMIHRRAQQFVRGVEQREDGEPPRQRQRLDNNDEQPLRIAPQIAEDEQARAQAVANPQRSQDAGEIGRLAEERGRQEHVQVGDVANPQREPEAEERDELDEERRRRLNMERVDRMYLEQLAFEARLIEEGHLILSDDEEIDEMPIQEGRLEEVQQRPVPNPEGAQEAMEINGIDGEGRREREIMERVDQMYQEQVAMEARLEQRRQEEERRQQALLINEAPVGAAEAGNEAPAEGQVPQNGAVQNAAEAQHNEAAAVQQRQPMGAARTPTRARERPTWSWAQTRESHAFRPYPPFPMMTEEWLTKWWQDMHELDQQNPNGTEWVHCPICRQFRKEGEHVECCPVCEKIFHKSCAQFNRQINGNDCSFCRGPFPATDPVHVATAGRANAARVNNAPGANGARVADPGARAASRANRVLVNNRAVEMNVAIARAREMLAANAAARNHAAAPRSHGAHVANAAPGVNRRAGVNAAAPRATGSQVANPAARVNAAAPGANGAQVANSSSAPGVNRAAGAAPRLNRGQLANSAARNSTAVPGANGAQVANSAPGVNRTARVNAAGPGANGARVANSSSAPGVNRAAGAAPRLNGGQLANPAARNSTAVPGANGAQVANSAPGVNRTARANAAAPGANGAQVANSVPGANPAAGVNAAAPRANGAHVTNADPSAYALNVAPRANVTQRSNAVPRVDAVTQTSAAPRDNAAADIISRDPAIDAASGPI